MATKEEMKEAINKMFSNEVTELGKKFIKDYYSRESNKMTTENTETIETEEKKEIFYKGTIIKVHPKGYGFITSHDVPFTRIFFHWSSLKQDTLNFTELKTGMKVEFIAVKDDEKGWQARKIKVIE